VLSFGLGNPINIDNRKNHKPPQYPRTGDLNQEPNLFQELKLFLLNLSCSGNAICVGRLTMEEKISIPFSNSSISTIKLSGDDTLPVKNPAH
jgi:hypothetical protein